MDRRASSSSSEVCRQRTRQMQQRFLLSTESTTSGGSRWFLSSVFSESVNREAGVLKRGGPLRHLNCTSTSDVYIPATAASVIRASADWQPKPIRRPRPAHRRTPNLAASSSSSSFSVQTRRRTNRLPKDSVLLTERLLPPVEPTLCRFQHLRQDRFLPMAIDSKREANSGELEDVVQCGIDAAVGPSIHEMKEPSFIVLPRHRLRSLHGLGFSHGTLREDSHTNIEQAADRFQNWRLDVDSVSYEGQPELGSEIGHVKMGLKEDEICGLEKTNKCNFEREEICSICLEEYSRGGKGIAKLECGHEYHASCIKKWLRRKSSCPICKGTVDHV